MGTRNDVRSVISMRLLLTVVFRSAGQLVLGAPGFVKSPVPQAEVGSVPIAASSALLKPSPSGSAAGSGVAAGAGEGGGAPAGAGVGVGGGEPVGRGSGE